MPSRRIRRVVDSEKVPPDQATSYFAAVGRFLVAFAEVEGSVHIAARILSGLSDRRARILLGGVRLNELIGKIRELMRLKRNDLYFAELDACLSQVEVLSKQRNKLVHRDVDLAKDGFVVTNESVARSLSRIEQEMFTVHDLELMRNDCVRIYVRLLMAAAGRKHWPNAEPNLGIPQIHGPWHYKPLGVAGRLKSKRKE